MFNKILGSTKLACVISICVSVVTVYIGTKLEGR